MINFFSALHSWCIIFFKQLLDLNKKNNRINRDVKKKEKNELEKAIEKIGGIKKKRNIKNELKNAIESDVK